MLHSPWLSPFVHWLCRSAAWARVASGRGLVVGCLCLGWGLVGAPGAGRQLTNPVAPIGNDPWVIRQGGDYYYCYSWDNGIWVKRAPRLEEVVKFPGKKVWTPPESGPYAKQIWAPELHWLQGKWYIYFAADDGANANHRMYVLEAQTGEATGAYTFKGKVAAEPDRWAIDGTVLTVRGELYFVWSGWPGERDGRQDLYIARMASPTQVVGQRVLLATPEHAWEKQGRPLVNEGPTALQRGGKTFIVYSASGSWGDHYCLGMLELVGEDPLAVGAWRKHPEPVFAGTAEVVSPGHASFTQSPNGQEDWIVYHAARTRGAGWKRNTRIQRFAWSAEGRPVFGLPLAPGVKFAAPAE